MNLCSGDRKRSHDEVCYEGSVCPVCCAMDDAEIEVNNLNKEIKELKEEIESMERDARDPIIAASKLEGET